MDLWAFLTKFSFGLNTRTFSALIFAFTHHWKHFQGYTKTYLLVTMRNSHLTLLSALELALLGFWG
jgi:hypothetical protein